MSTTSIEFAPLLATWIISTAGVMVLVLVLASALLGLKGWLWRGLAGCVLIGVLLNPALVRETREPLPDIALIVRDNSLSMQMNEREQITDRAVEVLRDTADLDPNLDFVEVSGGRSEDGTRLGETLRDGLGQIPRDQLAGVIILSDGQIHDGPLQADEFGLSAPVHHIVTGDRDAGDRRLIISQAPRYGLIGETINFILRVEDEAEPTGTAIVTLSVDGGEQTQSRIRIGVDVTVQASLNNRGPNTVQIEVEPGRQELSLINNRAAVSVTGVRDRMRVLLITGEPHNGARAWRNLLKSDPSVDLVHFTILRPLDKDDSVPGNELALIEFPVFELFQLRLEEFDLVIFDRYRRRGILRPLYFDNITRYVENGGALLVTTGPPFAGSASVARSPLASVLPASPNARIFEGPFIPKTSAVGARHPVTAPLLDQEDSWGPWYRRIGARAVAGETVLESPQGHPLLTLARAGLGRVAILLSDQAWLWARGHKGGGPHDELFRRVAHWLMGEPELNEDRLDAQVQNGQLTVWRTSLAQTIPDLTIEWPSGRTQKLDMSQTDPGRFEASSTVDELGLIRLRSGELTSVVASGPLNPLEYSDLRPDRAKLSRLVEPSQGGAFYLNANQPMPQIRRVSMRAKPSGTNWMGLQRRGAFQVIDAQRIPLIPALLAVAILLALLALAWRREGH